MNPALGFVSLLLGLVVAVLFAAKHRVFAVPLLVGYATRAVLAVVDALVYVLPGHGDSKHFDFFAYYWSRNGIAGTLDHITTGADLYTWVVSVFYAIFARSQLMMQGFNVLFGSLIILNVAQITRMVGGDSRLARQAAWWTALFPSLNYFAAVQLREVFVAYPLSLAVLYLARWYRSRKSADMVVAVLGLLTSMAFHSGSVAVLLAAGIWLVGSWIRSLFTRGFRNFGRNTIALAAGAGAIVFVLSSGFGMGKFKHVETGEVSRLTETQSNFAKGRAAYLEDFHPETRTELAVQTPLRLVYFLFAPFPWMLKTGSDVVGVIDSVFFFFLFFRIWRQRKLFTERRDAVLVLAVFGAMAVTFAIGVSNYGTALRHRNKMLPLLIGVALSVPWRRAPDRSKDPTDSLGQVDPDAATVVVAAADVVDERET